MDGWMSRVFPVRVSPSFWWMGVSDRPILWWSWWWWWVDGFLIDWVWVFWLP